MKYNLLVWTAHSCRRDVFLEELGRGNLPNYASVAERGLFFPSAVVGGHASMEREQFEAEIDRLALRGLQRG